jgi:lipopolysaccharide transport system ATP-binding protein
MSNEIIKVEALAKKYLLQHQQKESYQTFRDSLMHGFKAGLKRSQKIFQNDLSSASQEEFWALRDIEFSLEPGDRLGIIGRNGAGKSTLLKILSRIVEPTAGRITLRGRVASLLEVGTGFHPELTGRENIFLNGSILGMTRAEIKRKFDEIVAFSETEKFLDTPVKRYSSGMYVRLAFAVAAHLEPEILVVDEVLAVGDSQFQKKCLSKMESISGEGRTILFVSHNMEAVRKLCTKALVLHQGRQMAATNSVDSSIDLYMSAGLQPNSNSAWKNTKEFGKNSLIFVHSLVIGDSEGKPIQSAIRNDQDVWVYVDFELKGTDPALQIGYGIYGQDDSLLYWTCHTDTSELDWPKPSKGRNVFRSKIPSRFLNEGRYRVDLLVALYNREWIFQPGVGESGISFEIVGGLCDSPYWSIRRPGHLAPVLSWENF